MPALLADSFLGSDYELGAKYYGQRDYVDVDEHVSSVMINWPSETGTKKKSALSSQDDLAESFASLDLHEESFALGFFMEADKITEQDLLKFMALEPLKSTSYEHSELNNGETPGYITLGHEWLLKHLHNPYPSGNYKASLAQASGVSLKTINVWFANVRRRVGWTNITKRFFGGSRPDTVAYAHRIFKVRDTALPIDEKISAEFYSMKARAESLYQGRVHSDISPDLAAIGNAVKERSVSSTGMENARKRKRSSNVTDTASQTRRRTFVDDAEPSQMSKLLDFSYDSEDAQTPSYIRASSSSSSQSSSSRSSTPLPGTPRDEHTLEFTFETWRETVGLRDEECYGSSFASITPPARSRKRRLSQFEEAPNKRPRGAPIPRLHTVSDSYLLDHDDYEALLILSQIDFTLPEPVSLNEPLPQVFDMSLFQDWANFSEPLAQVADLKTFSSTNGLDQNDCSNQNSVEMASFPESTDFVDLDKLFEEVTTIPALPHPLLPDNTESLSFSLTTDDGKSDSSFSSLDLPLCTSVGADSRSVQPQFDLISMLVLPDYQTLDYQAGTETAGTDDLPETHSNASATAQNKSVADADAFQVLQKQADLEETTPGAKADDGISGSSDRSREGKLQKLQLLLAEAEKLKQELSC